MLDERPGNRFVVAFGMHAKNARGVRRHRRINVNRNARNFIFVNKQVQIINQFLRALNRKRRNYNLAFFFDCVANDSNQFVHREIFFVMLAIAVSAFADNVVGRGKIRGRIADNRLVAPPQIAGKKNSCFI